MRTVLLKCFCFVFLVLGSSSCLQAKDKEVIIASKIFTESNVLGEIAKEKIRRKGLKVTHKKDLGGTLILWRALQKGSIQAYPEYTGSIQEVILKSEKPLSKAQIQKQLEEFGVGITEELGFSNSYALVMKEQRAQALSINKISDLQKFPDLELALSHEFLKRQDGWKALADYYGLSMQNVKGIEHSLAYKSLASGKAELIDAYSTDPKINSLQLRILEDDLNFFPEYKAVFLYKKNCDPQALEALNELAGSISNSRMTELNGLAEKEKSYSAAALSYFGENFVDSSLLKEELKWIMEHLSMVLISMLIAVLAGIPLGIFCSRRSILSEFILGLVGVIQTIPSLALLAMLLPLFGISSKTAIIALFLYSLLPIVKNTSSGLKGIPQTLRDSAEVLGLSKLSQLLKIHLPLASRTIITGIRTSTIINLGTATLAALIGAGGLGEPIISGLYLNDSKLILQGAIPAALLAILAQTMFNFAERLIIPRGLLIRK